MVKVTRREAAAKLNVSKSTLDRMIKRGELTTETEQHGLKHTVWVLVDDVFGNTTEVFAEDTNGHTPDSTGDTNGLTPDRGEQTNGHIPDASEHAGRDTGAENLALQAEVKGLRELVDLYRERLTDADWRYQELMGQLKTTTAALPAPENTVPRAKRWWWPFR